MCLLFPLTKRLRGKVIEDKYIDILKKVKKKVNIPVALKLGSQFSGMAHMMHSFGQEGADGLVLFNRFYKPDIDIENFKLQAAQIFSVPEEMSFTLQWIAILAGKVNADLAATTGIHSSGDIIKQVLAVAHAVEMCSSLMKNGIEIIDTYLKEMEQWMDRKGFDSLTDFRGKMSQESLVHPEAYERSQYVKSLVGIE